MYFNISVQLKKKIHWIEIHEKKKFLLIHLFFYFTLFFYLIRVHNAVLKKSSQSNTASSKQPYKIILSNWVLRCIFSENSITHYNFNGSPFTYQSLPTTTLNEMKAKKSTTNKMITNNKKSSSLKRHNNYNFIVNVRLLHSCVVYDDCKKS